MTTPSGLPTRALQYYGAARSAVSQRASTREFYDALNTAATAFGQEGHGLSFSEVNQLRSAAVQVRNGAERFGRSPETNAITADMISTPPFARDQIARNAQPLYQVTINLATTDDEGNVTEGYRAVKFNSLEGLTKGQLNTLIGQDAEALADAYGTEYLSHDIVEILEL